MLSLESKNWNYMQLFCSFDEPECVSDGRVGSWFVKMTIDVMSDGGVFRNETSWKFNLTYVSVDARDIQFNDAV